jgi:glycopeptide antibiotics resistance protein
LLTETGREVYRPFIYRNQIADFGLADVIGNLLGTVAIIFFNLTIAHATRMQSVRIIIFATAGVMIYELLQSILPRGVLDWKDVWSTPIAGLFSLLVVSLVWRRIPDTLGGY